MRAPGRLIVLGTSRHMDDFPTNQDLAQEVVEIQHCENGDDARPIGLKLWELAFSCRRGQINVVRLYEPLPSNQPNLN